jgi:hypothetical protein
VNDKDLEKYYRYSQRMLFITQKPNNPRGLDATILAEKQEQTA